MSSNKQQPTTPLISGIGVYIPERRISNYDNAEKFDCTTSFIEEKIGFSKLSRKGEDETIMEMCSKAYDDLTRKISVHPAEVDLAIVVTQNPHFKIPHTSAILHNQLGFSRECMTFDVSQGCSGYIHGLGIVNSLMKTLGHKNAVLFTCDCYSDIIDPEDKNTSLLFGDAATATLISGEHPGYRLSDAEFGTMPDSYECLICVDKLKMDGAAVFNNAYGEIPGSIEKILDKNSLTKNDIDLYFLHPGSRFILDSIAKKLRLERSRVEFGAMEYGNTISSSIPIQLANYFDTAAKNRVFLSGFGVGFTWGNCILEYQN